MGKWKRELGRWTMDDGWMVHSWMPQCPDRSSRILSRKVLKASSCSPPRSLLARRRGERGWGIDDGKGVGGGTGRCLGVQGGMEWSRVQFFFRETIIE